MLAAFFVFLWTPVSSRLEQEIRGRSQERPRSMWGWGRKTEWGLDLLYSKLTGPPDGHPAALHLFCRLLFSHGPLQCECDEIDASVVSTMRRFHSQLQAVIVIALFAVLAPRASVGQQPNPSFQDMRLAAFVDNASARASEYFSFFKDLTAEELKTVEVFREGGEVSKRRIIVSDLIVYKSLLDNGSIAEYRDVKSVDAAPIAGREQRVQELFSKQSRLKSVRDELKRINAEGSRYDLDYTVSGLTMSQGLPLQPWARALFSFQESGVESIDGRDTVILSYQQVAPNSRFGFRLSLPSDLRAGEPLFRGWLWIDPLTSRLVREVREVTVLPAGSNSPVVVQRLEFRYEPSRFDLLLPRRIVFSSFGYFSRQGDAVTSSVKYRLTFAYGEFRRFTATSDDVQLADAESEGVAPGAAADEPASRQGSPPLPASDVDSSVADLGPEFGPDAPTGPPTAESTTRLDEATVPPVPAGAPTRTRRGSGRGALPSAVSAGSSARLTIQAGLPASAALAVPVNPMPVAAPVAGGIPSVAIPPPPLAPGEKTRFRPPPS